LIDDEPVVVTSLAALLGVDREEEAWTDVRPAVLCIRANAGSLCWSTTSSGRPRWS
jgi:hypothetical protein